MIDTIVFDLGNVILPFDFEKFVNGFSDKSPMSSEDIRKFIFEKGLKKKADKGEIGKFDFFKTVKEGLKIDFEFPEFKKIWCEIFTEDFQVIKLIRSLNLKGLHLILFSDTDELHYEYFSNRFDILKYFDDVILSFEIKHIKTEKESLLYLENRLKSKPENSIFIDDKKENLTLAKERGINCILYSNYDALLKELERYGVNISHPY